MVIWKQTFHAFCSSISNYFTDNLVCVCVFFQANIALFEARCKEKIQQFEDAGSDEEDIWDEKDITFAPEAQRRPRSAFHILKAHFSLFVSCKSPML